MNKLVPAVIVIILIIAAAFLLLSVPSAPSSGGRSSLVALQITDPAQVPAGTSALVVAYSGLAAHVSNAGNQSGWISANGSGTINLLAVVNLSQTIGTVSLPANASIEMVRFNVTSATITINGTTHNVTVPSGSVTAHITGRTTVNGNSSVLLDLSPVVASIITNTSTVFVLVPSLRAVVVGGGSTSATLHVGAQVHVNESEAMDLRENRPNVSITAASLSVSSGNVTHFSITLRDNSNQSVTVKHVGFQGPLSVQFNASSPRTMAFISNMTARFVSNVCEHINASIGSGDGVSGSFNISAIVSHMPANVSASEKARIQQILSEQNLSVAERLNAVIEFYVSQNVTGAQVNQLEEYFSHVNFGTQISGNYSIGGSRIQINSTSCTVAGRAALTSRLQAIALNFSAQIREEQSSFQTMIFSVQSDGTLSVPLGTEDFENSSQSYTLQSGQSVTLSFNGAIQFGNGAFKVSPVVGSAYKVGAQVEEEGIVFTNVTATSS